MAKRKIIKIDEEKCNGCGLCLPNCPEGALQMIDGKARLISDLFCDGLGACIGHCPEDAITIEERDAEAYNEGRVMENIVRQGKNVIKAHLEHLKEHGQQVYLQEAIDYLKKNKMEIPLFGIQKENSHTEHLSGCPGSRVIDFGEKKQSTDSGRAFSKGVSQLRQWPIQIMLVPINAPYFDNAALLIAADCVPFAYPDFHEELLKGKILLVGCPKLDDSQFYEDKITQILRENNIKSLTCVHMEVPCCFGLKQLVLNAIANSGKEIPFKETVVGVKGEKL